jgi:hypothetical protein
LKKNKKKHPLLFYIYSNLEIFNLQRPLINPRSSLYMLWLILCFTTALSQHSSNAPSPNTNQENQMDWNQPYRFKYTNTTKLKSNYRTSCTGYRPVCRSSDLLPGDTIYDQQVNTAGNTSTLGENGYYCNENRLEKPTIMLSAGSSWESTYIVWIAAILMQELLQVPVQIRQNVGSSHQFYEHRQPKTGRTIPRTPDILNTMDESRFIGLEVAHDLVNCDEQQFENISIMNEFIDHPECTNQGDSTTTSPLSPLPQCKPCQHAILDVWGGAKEQLERLVRVTEPGGPLGLVSSQGWYISSDVARMHPELASYRGLLNSNLTNKIFQRPLTFGEYCYNMVKRTNQIGTEWDESFCQLFFRLNDKVTVETCAFDPHQDSQTIPALHVCGFFMVTLADLTEYTSQSIASSISTSLNQKNPLYPGSFVRLGESQYDDENVETTSTYSNAIETRQAYNGLELSNGRRGWEVGGYILHSGCTTTGDPGGGKWAYDLPTMLQINDRQQLRDRMRYKNITINNYLPLKLTPYDTGDGSFRAWEVANRHRDGSLKSIGIHDPVLGSLLYHYRPHPVFQRSKYAITGFERYDRKCGSKCPFKNIGEAYQLTAVTMPPWNEQCAAVRQNHSDSCKLAATTKLDSNHVRSYKTDMEGPCGYRVDNVFKLFVGNLRDHSPEAVSFHRGTHSYDKVEVFNYRVVVYFMCLLSYLTLSFLALSLLRLSNTRSLRVLSRFAHSRSGTCYQKCK